MRPRYTIQRDEDGFWIYYGKGFKSSTDPVGVQHQDHADTRMEAEEMAQDAIACRCEECMSSGFTEKCMTADGGVK
jgi:hypothetical protein